jgi:hypothetical protein
MLDGKDILYIQETHNGKSDLRIRRRGTMHKVSGHMALFTSLSVVFCLIFIPVQCMAQASTTIYLGPFVDNDEKPISDGKVYVTYGSDSRNGTTGSNGTTHIIAPVGWLNKTVTVRFDKDGYKETTFTGYINNNSVFSPTDNYYPTIENSEKAATVDYSFVIVAFIVLIVLVLVLVGMKGEPEKKVKKTKFMDKEEGNKAIEEE